MAWKHFDLDWARICPEGAPIEIGTTVAVLVRHFGFWSLNGCRVLYFLGDRSHGSTFGFAYGTLANHAERGEEIFEVSLNRASQAVTYRIRAVSRPRAVLARLGYPATRMLQELWFNTGPILLEVGLPAFLMGFGFPLANALTQRADRAVGRRAGVLYFSNTCGAVCGSLAAGFLLLPALGVQGSATVLTSAAALAIVPLYLATGQGRGPAGLTIAAVTSGAAIGVWLLLPPDYVIARAAPPLENERIIARSELTSTICTQVAMSTPASVRGG